MHNPESVLENERYLLQFDFEMQTDHLISARKPDLVIVNKKKRTCRIVDFAVPADYSVKLKEGKKIDKYLVLVRELKKKNKKTMKHKVDGDNNSNWCS